MTDKKQMFVASKAQDAKFEAGLRSCFEYRDLGISEATHGQFHAAVSRVHAGAKGDQEIRTTGMHRHLCDFQMFYVLKGWIKFIYEGEGGVKTFGPGDCVLQPAGIVHNELSCSDDLELIEIYSPAVHETKGVDSDLMEQADAAD